MSGYRVGIGVLGCASIARRKLIPAVVGSSLTRLVAVASRDGAKAATWAAEFRCTPVEGYGRLLELPGIDAVYVALPAALHAEWAAAALRVGKHVLCEKPCVVRRREAIELTELARCRRLVLMENFTFLAHTQHAEVKRLVADGVIGEVRGLSAAFGIPARGPDDIRLQRALGGGGLLDVGCYPVRFAQFFLEENLTVSGAVLASDSSQGVDTSGGALLNSPDGVVANISFGLSHFYQSYYSIWGSLGKMTVSRAFTPPPALQPNVLIELADGTETRILQAADQFKNSIEKFAGLILSGSDSEDSYAAILRQAELLDQIRAAASHSGSVTPREPEDHIAKLEKG